MKHSWKRLFSVVLSLTMLFSLVPMVHAEENGSAKSAGPAPSASLEKIELTPVDPSTLELFQGEPLEEEALEQEPYALTDVLRVSIVLDKAATIAAGYSMENIAYNAGAKAYRDSLKAEQQAMTAKIESAIGGTLDVKWNLTLAMNAISANVRYGDIEAIKAVPGVKDVVIENRYELDGAIKAADEPNMGTSTVQTGSTYAWAAGYTGAGSKVAIIDTGLGWDHQSFDPDAFLYALDQDGLEVDLMTAADIDAVADQLNAPVSGSTAYINEKVPYGYCYVDGDFDVTHANDTQGAHGSHVAGIAAANRYISDGVGGYADALTAAGVQGVAPDAQLVVMKVFGNGGGAYDSDYMVAIEDAIVLGCDSANLSLGSGNAGLSFSGTYENVMNSLVENGMVVAMSAGNSYSWYDTPYNPKMSLPDGTPLGYLYTDDVNYDTTGSPGSFNNSLTMASVNNSGQIGMPIIFGDQGDLWVFYSETSGYSNEPITSIAGDYEYVFVDGPGVDDNGHVGAEGDDFLALGSEVVSGKVAICWRGKSSFFAKANAAVAQGAVAVIIANNQPGAINMNLTGYEYTAPAVSIYQEDGLAILDQSTPVDIDDDGEPDYYTGSMSITETMGMKLGEETNVQTMSDFSSWGLPGTLVLKPELTAPGGNIYCAVPLNYEGGSANGGTDVYESWSGTSMASPQVAGMAAVLGQYIRENGLEAKTGLTERQLVNSLLMGTAEPLVDDNGDYWSILKQGAGEANVGKAVQAKSYLLMDAGSTIFASTAADGKVKAELGDDPEKTGHYSFGFTINPLTDESLEYNLGTDLFIQWIAGNAGYGMLQDEATLGLALGEDFTVSYTVDGEVFEPYFTVDADVDQDGDTDGADAQAILDYVSGKDDGSALDLTVADLDGDEDYTTADARIILEALEAVTIKVEDQPVHVTVDIQLAAGTMDFIDSYYGATYIQGYTYVEGVSTEEGEIVDVEQSVPILGFYGSWTGPAMFDRTSVIDEAYGTGKLPYINKTDINYMTLKDAEGNTSVYMGNPFAVEDEFPAEKLALSSSDTVAGFSYMPIRNWGTIGFAVQDAEGKVLFSSVGGSGIGPYYYVNGGSWNNTAARSYSVNKALAGLGLNEGDQITVGMYLLPEYYAAGYPNSDGTNKGTLTNDEFAEVLASGVVGDGAAIKYTVTVDDTAPTVDGLFIDLISGKMLVKAQDNQYVAYMAITNKSGSKVYAEGVPAQSEAGEAVELELVPDTAIPASAVLVVSDYAGNLYAASFTTGAEPEDQSGLMIGFVTDQTSAAPGSGPRAWEIDPDALWYDHKAGTYEGLAVYADLGINVKAAEYADGYVFMAADDGYFYSAALEELGDVQRVGKYSDVTAAVYDMAFNQTNNSLYVLGVGNTVYRMDPITGALTAVAVVTLEGATGENARANTLAVDDAGTFYVANYGGPSQAYLYKFTLGDIEPDPSEPPEPSDPPEPPGPSNVLVSYDFETDPGAAGWTFVDSDGDGYNWYWHVNTGTGNHTTHSGDGVISSESYNNDTSKALTPDNWAVSPAIDLTEAPEGTLLSVWAVGQDPSYAAEHFQLYAGAAPTSLTAISTEFVATGSYVQYTGTIPSELIGQDEVYVAIRHFNVSDQFVLNVDDVEILIPDEGGSSVGSVMTAPRAVSLGVGITKAAAAPAEPADSDPETGSAPAAVTAARVGSSLMGVWNYSNGGALAWDHDKDILYLASNWNASQDYDHYLWIIDTETGVARRANETQGTELSNSNPSARLYGAVNGLFIVPGGSSIVTPAEEATSVEIIPDHLDLLRGQTVSVSADVYPWTLEDKSVTWSVGDDTVVSIDAEGTVTALAAGATTVTATTVAAPNLAATIPVTVEEAPVAELRGIIWDADGKGQASVFSTDATNEWTALGEVGQFRWGALVDDTVYSSTEDTMFAFDADTYESTALGGIVSDWIPSDAIALPADIVVGWGLDEGFRVGGLCYSGGYFEVLNPEAGSLNYWNLSSYYASDPMAVVAYAGRDASDTIYLYVITEGGVLWLFQIDSEGSMSRSTIGETGISLEGVADVTNEVWASLYYDADNDFLYLTKYDGSDDEAHLYAIDPNDVTRTAELGTFNESVWPVVGLYEYTPATDLTLKVSPAEVTLYEGESAELQIKVKLGETNAFTVESSDESVCTVDENGVITAVAAGTANVTVTTVDVNAAEETLSVVVPVTVKEYVHLDVQTVAQINDGFGVIDLNDLSYNVSFDAPLTAMSASLTGDIYMLGDASTVTSVSAADFQTDGGYAFGSLWSQYPAMDIANYPLFNNVDGDVDASKALFTTNLGWLVKPDYSGWNLSSVLSDMAAVAFGGDEDGIAYYYVLSTSGALYELDIEYSSGKISDFNQILDTGIELADQSDASMTFVVEVVDDAVNRYGLLIADNGAKKLWFVDFQTGETGLLGTVDADNIVGLVGSFDDQLTMSDYVEPTPDPLEGAAALASFDFESDPESAGWTFVDADNDGHNWFWHFNTGTGNHTAHSGDGVLSSESYNSDSEAALFPDNWAISPAIDLSAVSEGAVLSVWAIGQDTSYAAEHFKLYAGTSADPSAMTEISGDNDFVATGEYVRYTGDLSAFCGEDEVYVAIRHYNVSDQFILNVDDVQVLVPDEGGSVTEPATTARAMLPFAAARIGDGFAELNRAKTEISGIGMQSLIARPAFDSAAKVVVANAVVGGPTAIRGGQIQPQNAARDTELETEDDTLAVKLFEDVAVKNGKMTLTYDPAHLSVASVESSLEYKSWYDDASGTLTFAYASAEEIPAETVLATVKFAYTYDEDEGVELKVTVEVKERDDDLAVSEEPVEITLSILGNPAWTWTAVEDEDGNVTGYTATATFGEGEEAFTLEATVTKDAENSYPATCTEDGKDTYIATVTQGETTYTDTLVIEYEAFGHDWQFAEEDGVIWAEDYSSVTVNMVCGNDPTHTFTATTDEITATEDPAATCTQDGVITYEATLTATIDGVEETIQVSTAAVAPALGHVYSGEPTWEWYWTWDQTVAEVTMILTCDRCGVAEVLEATVTSETTEPTCTEAGETVYTATVEFEGETYTDTKSVVISAKGHAWGEPVWTWAEDHSGAIATFTCLTDAGHTTDVEAEVDITSIEPDCLNEGSNTWLATVEFEGETYTDEQTETIPATGHTEGEPVVENEIPADCENAGSYDLVVYCTVCGEELSRETVVVPATGHTEGEAVKENEVAPTCETAGSYDMVVYCTVCGEELSRETTTIPATGHAWSEPEWSWSEDKGSAVVTFTCANDPSHVETLIATVTKEVVDNQNVYTATVEFNGETHTATETTPYTPPEVIYIDTTPSAPKFPFVDVEKDRWSYNDIKEVYEAGLMVGVSSDHFDPTGSATRAMIVTMIYRLAGEPEVTGTTNFNDVVAGSYYENAVIWGTQIGVVKGMSETVFAPNKTVTREQLAAFIYRYAQIKGLVKEDDDATAKTFDDSDKVSDWAAEAMDWCVAHNIIGGMGENELRPRADATREQIAAAFNRFSKLLK